VSQDTKPDTGPEATKRAASRRARWSTQRELRGLATQKRVRRCGFAVEPEVEIRHKDGVAYASGIGRCGSVWSCPVCAATIRQRRTVEVDQAGKAWNERAGCRTLMLTLTMPHHGADKLSELWDVLAGGWRQVMSGRAAQEWREQFRVAGWIRAIEVTHGEHGWHPHLHVLLFVQELGDKRDQALRLSMIRQDMAARWATWVEGTTDRETNGRTVDAQWITAAGYLTKLQDGLEPAGSGPMALELVRGDLKQGRRSGLVPFLVGLRAVTSGENVHQAQWREFQDSSKGRRFLTWSRFDLDGNGGIRQQVALADVDVTDEDLAQAEVGGVIVYTLPAAGWGRALTRGWVCQLLERAERLVATAGPPAEAASAA